MDPPPAAAERWARLRRALAPGMRWTQEPADRADPLAAQAVFTVTNHASGAAYTVTVGPHHDIACTCPDAQFRRRRCKHQLLCLVRGLGLGPADPRLWERCPDLGQPASCVIADGACALCHQSLAGPRKRKRGEHPLGEVSVCTHCSTRYHHRCMDTWREHSGAMSCPFCQHPETQ